MRTGLDAIEAKGGGPEELAERLVQPLKDLLCPVKVNQIMTWSEIGILGLDMNREVVKAVRKFPTKHNPNRAQPLLGTILVEMMSEDSQSKVMRSKHELKKHA